MASPPNKDLAGYTFHPKTPTEQEKEAILDVAKNAWDQIATAQITRLVGGFLIQPVFRIYTDKGVEDHILDWADQPKKLAEMERMRDLVERIGKGAYFAALVAHTGMETPGSLFSTAPTQPQLGAMRVQVESSDGCLVVCSAQYHWPAGAPPFLDAPSVDLYHEGRSYHGPLAGFYRRHLTALSKH